MKTKLLWIQGLACNGNSHSFFNYASLEQFLKDFSFVHHPIIDSRYTLEEVTSSYHDTDILLIEGAIADDFKRADKTIVDIINLYGPKVKKIVTVGTCATFGGIFKESPYQNPSGFLYREEHKVDRFDAFSSKVVSISGCPIHPEVLASTLYMLKEQITPHLDNFHRPKEFFAYTVHNGCTRNEYFEYKVDNHNFGEKEGCMFYDHGCQAPFTHGSCNKILWNEVNSKTRNGEPCHGCTEPHFPSPNLFVTKKNMGIPQYLPFDVPKRAYLTLTGVTKAFKINRLEEDLF
jgi:hydrogenase small subunit